MYLTGVDLTIFALDPTTVRELWKFNPERTCDFGRRNRGLAYWVGDRTASVGRRIGEKPPRIILAIPDGKMFSLDS
jgi:glucose dehydrogenase